ncbi:MAG: hypothetical protein MZW92_73820 [Comamonadaceae bacterium]|nr:hypothetical protein [Comamonadaceae bacterium]
MPGVGKSTFIEALGLYLIEQRPPRRGARRRPVVAASRGGSILGDKTRMERLSVRRARLHPPQPGRRHARRRGREDARGDAGLRGRRLRRRDRRDRRRRPERDRGGRHDRHVRAAAAAQRRRRPAGHQEGRRWSWPTSCVVNKADLDEAAATRARAQITQRAARPAAARTTQAWQPQVLQLSALKGTGLDEFWAGRDALPRRCRRAGGRWPQRRRAAGPGLDVGAHRGRPARSASAHHPAVRAALPAHHAPTCAAGRAGRLGGRAAAARPACD